MKVRFEKVPDIASVRNSLPQVDFKDTFATTNHKDNLEKVAHKVFGSFPLWVRKLLQLRNFLVQFMGLKVVVPADYHNRFEAGGYVGFFKIYKITSDELIMGLNDKHLNFRVSIYDAKSEKFNIKVTTLVEYNNTFGKVYMFIVKPFHHFVVKSAVKQAYCI